jgi:hypothetical protein
LDQQTQFVPSLSGSGDFLPLQQQILPLCTHKALSRTRRIAAGSQNGFDATVGEGTLKPGMGSAVAFDR